MPNSIILTSDPKDSNIPQSKVELGENIESDIQWNIRDQGNLNQESSLVSSVENLDTLEKLAVCEVETNSSSDKECDRSDSN